MRVWIVAAGVLVILGGLIVGRMVGKTELEGAVIADRYFQCEPISGDLGTSGVDVEVFNATNGDLLGSTVTEPTQESFVYNKGGCLVGSAFSLSVQKVGRYRVEVGDSLGSCEEVSIAEIAEQKGLWVNAGPLGRPC